MKDVEALTIRPFELTDTEAVLGLWHACGLVVPWNDPEKDIARKRAVQPELFLVGCLAGRVVAVVMAGYEGHRGQVNYLAVDPALQGGGVGRKLMDDVEARLRSLGCPKINLEVRTSNVGVLAFYERLGFAVNDTVSLGKRLVDDE